TSIRSTWDSVPAPSAPMAHAAILIPLPFRRLLRRKSSRELDHDLARLLRIVLEEGLLVFQILLSGLHHAVDIRDARDKCVLAGRWIVPRVGEQLPGELLFSGWIHRDGLPRAVVNFDFDSLQRCAVVV